jgi:hypothetical protein
MLLVLVIREAGLRSTLVAQLSMAGASVITARDLDDPMLERSIRGPAMLVIEDRAVAAQPDGWLASELEGGRWHGIVLLTTEPPREDRAWHPSLTYVDRASASASIGALLEQWCADA